jgi:hypothetical protein
MPLEPSRLLEQTIKDINYIFQNAKVPYWLCFGGLWGLIMDRGIIPDGDFDLCTYYGEDHEKLIKFFEHLGYSLKKVLLSDTDTSKAMYMGFDNRDMSVHVCVSFWYPYKNLRFYCHDQNNEVGARGSRGIPSAKGYFLRGIERSLIDGDDKFRMVDWLGIPGRTKIRVPRFPGYILDCCYPDWAYWKQRHNVGNYTDQPDKCVSINDHKFNKNSFDHATSQNSLNLMSIGEFANEAKIDDMLETSRKVFLDKVKRTA